MERWRAAADLRTPMPLRSKRPRHLIPNAGTLEKMGAKGRFFFAACVRLSPRWVPLRLNHQGNHAHRRTPTEPAPSHSARSIGPPPATTSACTADPRGRRHLSRVPCDGGATSGTTPTRDRFGFGAATPPTHSRSQESGACLSAEYHASCFSLALGRRSCPRPYGMHSARAHVQARWPVRPRRSAFPGASIPSPQTRSEALRQSTHSDPHASAVAVVEAMCGRRPRCDAPLLRGELAEVNCPAPTWVLRSTPLARR